MVPSLEATSNDVVIKINNLYDKQIGVSLDAAAAGIAKRIIWTAAKWAVEGSAERMPGLLVR